MGKQGRPNLLNTITTNFILMSYYRIKGQYRQEDKIALASKIQYASRKAAEDEIQYLKPAWTNLHVVKDTRYKHSLPRR